MSTSPRLEQVEEILLDGLRSTRSQVRNDLNGTLAKCAPAGEEA